MTGTTWMDETFVARNYASRRLIIFKDMLERITIDPEICHGKPCIRGMRWPVEVVLDLLGSGMSIESILKEHPELEREDILAAVQFARLAVSGENLDQVA